MRRVRGKMLTALLKNNPEQAVALAKELSKDYKDILLINVLDILKTNKKLTPTDRLELYKDFFDTSLWLSLPKKENLVDWDKNARKQLMRRAHIELAEQDRIIQTLLISILKTETQNLAETWLALKNSHPYYE